MHGIIVFESVSFTLWSTSRLHLALGHLQSQVRAIIETVNYHHSYIQYILDIYLHYPWFCCLIFLVMFISTYKPILDIDIECDNL